MLIIMLKRKICTLAQKAIDHFKQNIRGLELTVEELRHENSEAAGDIAAARAEVCLSHSHAYMHAVILLYNNLGRDLQS